MLDQDDFSKLASRGLKPLYGKKLELWCGAVRERVENMLPSSFKTPAASALLSSEALNVVTPAAHSVGAEDSECESGAENESERDGEDDDDSDDDLEIVGEESGTADSTGASSARGLETGTCMKLPRGFMPETYSGIHLEIIKVSLVTVKQAWI